MPPPTSLPRWADGGSAVITEPSEQQKDTGWVPEDIPAADEVNWWKNLVYQWIDHLAGAAAKYDTLEDAVDGLSVGDTAIVDEHDLDQSPGTVKTSVDLGGTNSTRMIAVDGEGVYIEVYDGANYTLKRYARADLTTVLATYTPPASALNERRFAVNGQYVVVCTGPGTDSVVCYALAGGAALWTYAHDADINDIAIDGTRCYIVSTTGGASNRECVAITLATGVAAWTYRHNGTLTQVATNGKQVFVGGNASGFASGATHRALEASTGNDLNNEGGSTATSTNTTVWNKVATLTASRGCMVTDGRRLYVGFQVGVGDEVEAWSCATGETYGGVGLGATCSHLAVDQDFLLVVIDADPNMTAYDKRTLQPIFHFTNGSSLGTTPIVVSDGCAIFIVNATSTTIRRLYRGNRPKLWRRVDPTDNYLPYRQLIIPEE
jgi:hypothetical protein